MDTPGLPHNSGECQTVNIHGIFFILEQRRPQYKTETNLKTEPTHKILEMTYGSDTSKWKDRKSWDDDVHTAIIYNRHKQKDI